ncbi:unnamed protein product [Schistosoma intercalatum]|nr:unnamed protein product [Schistosoma intercalatum]
MPRQTTRLPKKISSSRSTSIVKKSVSSNSSPTFNTSDILPKPNEGEYYEDDEQQTTNTNTTTSAITITTVKPKRTAQTEKISEQKSSNQLKPMLKKTIVYKQAPSLNSSDEYYDDEITETTWVIKLGDKNVTDKDMLDFINSQINGGTLLQNNSTKLNTTSSDKNNRETETSWFSVPETKNMNEKWISQFLDNDNDIDISGKNGYGIAPSNTTRQLVSKSFWISDDFEKELKEMDFLGMLRNSTELNDIINKKLDFSSSFSLNDNSTTNNQINLELSINKLLLVTLCLQIIPYECQINVVTKEVGNNALPNESTNTSSISNPVKSVSLHFCRSARGINQSDPNSVPKNTSDARCNIPIGHLTPKGHELKSISINFDAKCLPKPNPLLQGENVIKVVGHSPQSNVINMRNETKYHSADIAHIKYDQPVNIQAVHILIICVFYIILFKFVNLIHFVLLNNIKGESENNGNMNVRMITRRIRRVLGKIHSDKASPAEADNKRTVVNIKQKDITTVDNGDTLKDWKTLIRRKKDDLKRVLIKRVKAKKRDVNEHNESSKSKERFIVQKIRRHVQKEAEAAKNRILISELSLLFPFLEKKYINLII